MATALFHLAFPVADIPTTRKFYVEGLGCEPGRETPHSLILNLFGHQLVAHTTDELTPQKGIYPPPFWAGISPGSRLENAARASQGKAIGLLPGRKATFPRFGAGSSDVFFCKIRSLTCWSLSIITTRVQFSEK